MSIFATLRKKGKKLSAGQEQAYTQTLGLPASSSIFRSEPNLQKLDVESDNAETGDGYEDEAKSPPRTIAEQYCYDHERNQYFRKSAKSSKYKYLDRKSSLTNSEAYGSTPSSSALLSSSSTGTPKSKSSSPSSLRSFVSMVSMASGLRRSKSIRKQAFASAIHLRPSTGQEEDGVILEDSASASPRPSSAPTNNTTRSKMQSSSSAPTINSRLKRRQDESNSEPGVGSSCSSLSSSGSASNSNQSGLLSVDLDSRKNSTTSLNSKGTNRDSESPIRNKPSDEEIARTKMMLQAAKKFNMDPKKGIDFLVLNGLIERNAEEVAQFLKDGEGLSKSAIGNYLGEHHEFNLEVLQAFVDLHDFTNVLVVQALRQFLWSFRLPGEAQKIDRMMEAFAKRYTLANPELFANSDTCYLLAFAIIMLNTSLHNPSVKDKPTIDQFIRMNRDIDGGKALDREYIVSLYHSILNEPFAIPPEDGNDLMLTFFNPEIEGWLWKQGGRYKTWKRRWFILSNNCIYYFLFTTDKDPRGIIPLENIVVKKSSENFGKKFAFVLCKEKTADNVTDYIKSCKTSDGKLTAGRHTSYHLATASKAERNNWIKAISINNSSHDFYSLLARKKNHMESMSPTQRGSLTRPKKPQSPQSLRVRKSQISFPISRPPVSTSLIQDPELLHPHSLSKSYSGLSNASEDSGSSFSVNFPSDNESGSDSSLSQISFQVPPPITRRVSDHEASASSGRRVRSKLSKSIRKLSLPHESKLCSKEYLSMPSIRISVEDADAMVSVSPSENHSGLRLETPVFQSFSSEDSSALSPVIDFELEDAFTSESAGSTIVENPADQVKIFQHEDKVVYVPLKQEELELAQATEAINEHVGCQGVSECPGEVETAILKRLIETEIISSEREFTNDFYENETVFVQQTISNEESEGITKFVVDPEFNPNNQCVQEGHEYFPNQPNEPDSAIVRRQRQTMSLEDGELNRENALLKHKNRVQDETLYKYDCENMEYSTTSKPEEHNKVEENGSDVYKVQIQTQDLEGEVHGVIENNGNEPVSQINYKTDGEGQSDSLIVDIERHTEI